MHGYLSIFTKSLLIMLIISTLFITYGKLNEYRYNYISYREKVLEEKKFIKKSVEQRLSEQIEVSCIAKKQYTREYILGYDIEIVEDRVCGKERCYDLNITYTFPEKIIKKGKHYITVDCEKRVVYD